MKNLKSKFSDFDNIFLTYEIQNINKLFINIIYDPESSFIYESHALLKLEVKTNKSPSTILEKNYINKGFITSNLEYKHFYFEVFQGEGGEIILHDKRQFGILIGSIVKKSSINNTIINMDIYPTINSNNKGSPLNYDKHFLKLYFNFKDTEICEEGCYILISYYHEKFASKNDVIIGFEFTLLLRIWDDREFKSQIINIPLNEYALGLFEEKSVKKHFYSFYFSSDIDEIYLQIQGQNIKGYYGGGKRKISENLIWHNVYDLDISKPKDIKDIYKNKLQSDYVSFLIKPKDKDSFSFYYFRILLKTKSKIILPLDSNLGNNCLLDNNYCQFLLKNDYNIFSLNLTIFNSEQNIYFSIFSMNIDDYDIFDFERWIQLIEYDISNFSYHENHYINIENNNSVEYIFLIIYSSSDEGIISNVLSTFYDVKKEINPNVYSSNIYKLDNIAKYVEINLNKDFKINFCSFYGEGTVNLKDFFEDQIFTQYMLRQYYTIKVNVIYYTVFEICKLFKKKVLN